MIDKRIDIEKAVRMVPDGASIMFGGFGQSGSPRHLIRALSDTGVKGLHSISDDLGLTFRGFSQTLSILIDRGQISEATCCFIGQNPTAGKKYMAGEIKMEFVPIGTFAERIRAGGNGIGGFYTKTGIGTMVEEGKETKIIDGEKYILEKPLHADVAFVKAWKADYMGNAIFRYTSQNYNPVMATAADLVILEAEEVVPPGTIEPDRVQLPGVFVDYVVEAGDDIL